MIHSTSFTRLFLKLCNRQALLAPGLGVVTAGTAMALISLDRSTSPHTTFLLSKENNVNQHGNCKDDENNLLFNDKRINNYTNHHHQVSSSFQEQRKGVNMLRKRMTAIGKFSLKSQTESNPSQPTFFLALSNHTRDENITKDPTMTVSEFQETWYRKQMNVKHPRFHAKVSSCGEFFEPTNSKSSNYDANDGQPRDNHDDSAMGNDVELHMRETLHMQTYRHDLKHRIETFLTHVMDVTEKLWEVQISSGDLGTSGGISHKRCREIYREIKQRDSGNHMNSEPKETILLFRSHHSLADAVSIVTALGDLLDEAQEIQGKIKKHLERQKEKIKNYTKFQKLWKWIQSVIWFLMGSLHAIMRQGYLILTTPQNPFMSVAQLTPDQVQQMSLHAGRSISWCDVAPVDEAKEVAKALGGPKTTVNDLFVSCVSAAVAKQFSEHRKEQKNMNGNGKARLADYQRTINVVIPAHLSGGVLPPGREIGNLIGAFVASVPGEMVDTATCTERLKKVHASLDAVKHSPAPLLSFFLAKFASNYLPESLAKLMFQNSNANAAVAITNSRGYEKKVHINGRTVENMAGFYPLPPGLPVGVVVQSYGNIISLSVTAEKWAVPDADVFLGWILDEYRMLYAEAMLKAKNKK